MVFDKIIKQSKKEKHYRDTYVKTLKANKSRDKYSTLNRYLSAVYKKNKEYIDARMVNNTGVSNSKLFQEKVKQYMQTTKPNGRKMNVKEAIAKVKASTLLTNYEERKMGNVQFKDWEKGAYKEIKKKSGIKNKSQYNGTWIFVGYGKVPMGNKDVNFEAYYSMQNGRKIYMVVLLSPKGNKDLDVKIVDSVEFRYGYESYL